MPRGALPQPHLATLYSFSDMREQRTVDAHNYVHRSPIPLSFGKLSRREAAPWNRIRAWPDARLANL